jgi:hypothetical protein
MSRMIQILGLLVFAFGCSQVEPETNMKHKQNSEDGEKKKEILQKTTNDHFTTHYGLQQTSLARPKIAERFLVAETLTMAFGPVATGAISQYVLKQGGSFGGPCDHYGEVGKNNCGIFRSQSQLSLTPFSLTAREAWRMKACETITVQDAAITYAVTTALGFTTDTLPEAAHIRAAYNLFYSGRKIPAEVSTAFQVMMQKLKEDPYTKMDAWRTMLLTLCLSPGWQVL